MKSDKAFLIVLLLFFVILCLFFSPRLRYDGLHYLETARSLVIDKDINTFKERVYRTEPAWHGFYRRPLFQTSKLPIGFVGFMRGQEITENGYAFTVFPTGNTIMWLPFAAAAHATVRLLNGWGMNIPETGWSKPYVIISAMGSVFYAVFGLFFCYRILRRWFDAFPAAFAVASVFACFNLIPFIFIDPFYSHILSFFIIGAFIMMRFQSLDHRRFSDFFLWGLLGGLSITVRYQDVTLFLIPFVDFAIDFSNLDKLSPETRKIRKKRFYFSSLVFIIGSLTAVIPQLVYWKIQHGAFIIPPETMGTGHIPTFNLFKPQIIAMLFSSHHGLLSWMPLTAPAILAFFAFPFKKDKRLGTLLIVIFLLQTYYNSCRSEWWNLGFSVRRYSSYALFFMIGMAIIAEFFRKKTSRILLTLIVAFFAYWNILFMIQFYDAPTIQCAGPYYRKIVGEADAYKPPSYHWIGPQPQMMPELTSAALMWFVKASVPAASFAGIVSPESSQFYYSLAAGAGFFIIAVLLFLFSKLQLFNAGLIRGKISTAFIGLYFLLFTAAILLMHYRTEPVRVLEIKNGQFSGATRTLRLKKGDVYLGENEVAELDTGELIKIEMKERISTDRIEVTLLFPVIIPGDTDFEDTFRILLTSGKLVVRRYVSVNDLSAYRWTPPIFGGLQFNYSFKVITMNLKQRIKLEKIVLSMDGHGIPIKLIGVALYKNELTGNRDYSF